MSPGRTGVINIQIIEFRNLVAVCNQAVGGIDGLISGAIKGYCIGSWRKRSSGP